jgi:hypothetical protein
MLAALALVACGGSNKPGGASGGGGTGASGSAGKSGAGTNVGGKAPSGEGGENSSGEGPTAGCDCDDNVLCTLDECVEGACVHTPRHFQCLGGSYCSLTEGCENGEPCASDDDCTRPDNCVTVKCDPKLARCSFHYLDSDADGDAPIVCGGKDCNDAEFWVHADAPETCDGQDNDCDGLLDPPKTSGCLTGESCLAGACRCDGATSTCKVGTDAEARVCVDLKTDAKNCNSCGHACAALEVCNAGACTCQAPLASCGNKCADLTTDAKNCGKCGTNCGNAECVAAACECPEDTENCGSAASFDCRDTQTDAKNCGACGETCAGSSGCANGTCDAEVQYVRMYGSNNGGKPQYGSLFPLASDTQGNIFAGLTMVGGDQYELPNGQTAVWGGAFVVAKLDAAASVLWTVQTTLPVSAIASAGDDVWIAVNAASDFTVGNKAFTRKADHQNMLVLVKLKGSTGAILAQDQLDMPQAGGFVSLAADLDGAWVAFDTVGDVGHGAATFTQPPGGYSTLLYATASGATRWLPGYFLQLSLAPNGKVFVGLQAEGVDITLGGAPFTPTRRFGQWAAARYSKALVHEASALMPATFDAGAVAPDTASTFWTNGPVGLLEEYDYAGARLSEAGAPPYPFGLLSARVRGNKVFAYGATNAAGGVYGGRTFAGNQVMLAKFDKATKALENSLAISTTKDPDGPGGSIGGMVVTDNGAAVVLAMGFDDALSITGGASYDATGKSGVAFVKVKLPAP